MRNRILSTMWTMPRAGFRPCGLFAGTVGAVAIFALTGCPPSPAACNADEDCAAGARCVAGACAAARDGGGNIDRDGGTPLDAGGDGGSRSDGGVVVDAGAPDGGVSDAPVETGPFVLVDEGAVRALSAAFLAVDVVLAIMDAGDDVTAEIADGDIVISANLGFRGLTSVRLLTSRSGVESEILVRIVVAEPWSDDGFLRRTALTLDHDVDVDSIDLPVPITISPAALIVPNPGNGRLAQSVFVDGDARPIDVESAGGTRVVWVEPAVLAANARTVALLYVDGAPTKDDPGFPFLNYSAVYHLTDGVDASVAAAHGTLVGTTSAIGRVGGARVFDGVDDDIVLPNGLTTLSGASVVRMSSFIKLDVAPPNAAHIIGYSAAPPATPNSSRFEIVVKADLHILATLRGVDAASPVLRIESVDAVPLFVWSEVAVIVDVPTSSMRVFIDGVESETLVVSAAVLGDAFPNTPSQASSIGSEESLGTELFPGALDEIRVTVDALADEARLLAERRAMAPGFSVVGPHVVDVRDGAANAASTLTIDDVSVDADELLLVFVTSSPALGAGARVTLGGAPLIVLDDVCASVGDADVAAFARLGQVADGALTVTVDGARDTITMASVVVRGVDGRALKDGIRRVNTNGEGAPCTPTGSPTLSLPLPVAHDARPVVVIGAASIKDRAHIVLGGDELTEVHATDGVAAHASGLGVSWHRVTTSVSPVVNFGATVDASAITITLW